MPAKFKHLIEEAKAETFKAMDDGELRDFRFRFVQLFERFFHDPATDQIRGMAKVDFLSRYVELRIEMTRRGLGLPGEREIDRLVKDRVVRKGLWSLDVPGLGDVVLAMDYVAITGDYIRDPREAGEVQVVIKAAAGARSVALEASLARILGQETGKEIRIAYEGGGCAGAYMPVFDLILRPKATNRISPAGPEGKTLYGGSEAIEKALTEAEKASIAAESAIIRESAKTARAKGVHKFEPAKWTHPNGHPRCLICGEEEPVGGICHKPAPAGPPEQPVDVGKGGPGSGNFGHEGGGGGEGNPGGSQGTGGGEARATDPNWHEGMTRDDAEAVRAWTGWDHEKIRDVIATGVPNKNPRINSYAKNIDSMFDRFPNGGAQDKEMWRGIADVPPSAFNAITSKGPGELVQIDRAPQGWSTDKGTADFFATGTSASGPSSDTILYHLPAGRQTTRELTVDKISGRPKEKEVLLRDTKFKIGSIKITSRQGMKGTRSAGKTFRHAEVFLKEDRGLVGKGGEGSGNFEHAGGDGGPGNPGGSQGGGGGTPEDVASAVMEYQNYGYQSINGLLRGEEMSDAERSAAREKINHLDRAMKPMPESYFFRGDGASISADMIERTGGPLKAGSISAEEALHGAKGQAYMAELRGRMVGREFTDRGFMSATKSEAIAREKFVFPSQEANANGLPAMVEIHAPKGTMGLRSDDHSVMRAGEKEHILARGTRLRITGVEFKPGAYSATKAGVNLKIKCEVVGQEGGPINKGGAGSGNFGHAGGEGGPGNPGGSAASLGVADVYHGTTRKALESIIADGIKPAQGQHYRKELYYGDRAGAVFVTTSKLEAEDYARLAGRKEKADEIAVIHVRLPAGTKLQVDTEHYGSGKAFYTRQAIKPGSIIGAKIIDVRTRESRTISLKADRGIPEEGDIYVVVLIRNDPDTEGGVAKGGPGSGNFGHAGGEGGPGNPGGSQGTGGGEARAVDDKWIEQVTPQETKAVDAWTGTGYVIIRDHMAGNPTETEWGKDAAKDLNAMFDKYPNGGAQDRDLHRGLSEIPDDVFASLASKQPGDSLTIDKAPQSWSKYSTIAEDFAAEGNTVMFSMSRGRQTTRELDIDKLGLNNEKEVIMATRSFRVVRVEKTTYDRGRGRSGDRLRIHLVEDPGNPMGKGGEGSGNFGHEGGTGGEGNPGGSGATGGGQPRAVDEKWGARLPLGDKNAVLAWTAGSYENIRLYLSSGKGEEDYGPVSEKLMGLFDKYPNGRAQDKEIFRGLHDVDEETWQDLAGKQPGDKVEIDKCPQSWTKDPAIVEKFGRLQNNSVVFKMAPGRQQTKELDVSRKSPFPEEKEVIMGNFRFKIAAVEKKVYNDFRGKRLTVTLEEEGE